MKGLLATIRWHDAIDVALCAAIVYRVLAAFRGTRAVQMVLETRSLGRQFHRLRFG